MVMERPLVAVLVAASVTCTVKLTVPATVGVPVMAPVEDRPSPAGRAPALIENEYGGVPPLAATLCE